jgi:hypothetical protein
MIPDQPKYESSIGGSAQLGPEPTSSRLDRHVNMLHEILNGLDKANLQSENLLTKLRGSLESTIDPTPNKITEQQSVMTSLESLGDEILGKIHRYNNMIDEIKEQV